ncbi:2-oxo acid dehydrogenase subunit E2 [bacterium]|nr:2-oxo acid dehydrogenase subunit E2 [bacterium]
MAVEVVFPSLGLSAGKGHIVKWLKSEGDRIEKGDPLVEIESEKVVMEIESPASGILRKILVNQDVEISTLAVIGVITDPDEALPEKYLIEKVLQDTTAEPSTSGGVEEPVSDPGKQVSRRKIIAVPLVRKLAKDHGVDLSLLSGTGPGGRITKEDVLRNVEKDRMIADQFREKEPGVDTAEVSTLSSMRETIARRMTESFQSPHFYLTVEVDTQELAKTRERLIPIIENRVGIRLTYTDLIIMMTARSLEENISVNCAYDNGNVKFFKRIDIGLVTAVEGGILVPTIHEANKKSLAEIAKSRAGLTQKARERKLSREEMTGSTFTITNLGMFEIDQFSAILQPPEAAILAVGRISDRVVARDGQIVIRPMMTLTLSIDHRVLDGMLGAQFMKSLKHYIECPNLLLA